MSGAHRGTLYLRLGPMFSGKSTWLNAELTQMADTGFQVLKISHQDDQRTDVACCDESGSTHHSSYKQLSSKITCLRTDSLATVKVDHYNVIGIDEAQFFPDLLLTVTDWIENQGKHVRVAGLDGDFKKQKFGQTLDLIPLCDEVIKMKASCQLCLAELKEANFHGNLMSIAASFTKRLGASDIQKEVGGAGQYMAVCRYHHAI